MRIERWKDHKHEKKVLKGSHVTGIHEILPHLEAICVPEDDGQLLALGDEEEAQQSGKTLYYSDLVEYKHEVLPSV